MSKNIVKFCALLSVFPLSCLAASHHKVVYINQYDIDEDGKASSVEFETARRARFDISDDDNNGIIDEEEYVFEYENRMDAQLMIDRKEQVLQTATRFDSLDSDENEVITWEEYEASGLWSFNRFDSNEDGLISAADVDPMADSIEEADDERSRDEILRDAQRILSMPSTHSMEGTLRQYDSNGNDSVTLEEFTSVRKESFTRMDMDGKGGLSEDEYLAEFEDRLDQQISSDRKGQIEQTRVRFGILDDDENGEMTYKEYQASGHRSFTRWDTDGDGFVSMEDADPVEPEFSQAETDDKEQNI